MLNYYFNKTLVIKMLCICDLEMMSYNHCIHYPESHYRCIFYVSGKRRRIEQFIYTVCKIKHKSSFVINVKRFENIHYAGTMYLGVSSWHFS